MATVGMELKLAPCLAALLKPLQSSSPAIHHLGVSFLQAQEQPGCGRSLEYHTPQNRFDLQIRSFLTFHKPSSTLVRQRISMHHSPLNLHRLHLYHEPRKLTVASER